MIPDHFRERALNSITTLSAYGDRVCLLPFLQHSWGPLMLSSLMHFSSFIIPETVQLHAYIYIIYIRTHEVRETDRIPLTVIHKHGRCILYYISSPPHKLHHFSKVILKKKNYLENYFPPILLFGFCRDKEYNL